jgi:hypothetical protein
VDKDERRKIRKTIESKDCENHLRNPIRAFVALHHVPITRACSQECPPSSSFSGKRREAERDPGIHAGASRQAANGIVHVHRAVLSQARIPGFLQQPSVCFVLE